VNCKIKLKQKLRSSVFTQIFFIKKFPSQTPLQLATNQNSQRPQGYALNDDDDETSLWQLMTLTQVKVTKCIKDKYRQWSPCPASF